MVTRENSANLPLAVVGTAILFAIFLGNETIFVVWPTLVYGVIRVAVIPLAAAVNLVALAFWWARNADIKSRISCVVFALATVAVWTFQWLASYPLFGLP